MPISCINYKLYCVTWGSDFENDQIHWNLFNMKRVKLKRHKGVNYIDQVKLEKFQGKRIKNILLFFNKEMSRESMHKKTTAWVPWLQFSWLQFS